VIASIHDDGMSPDKEGSNVQTLAMLWRVFTTRLDDGTYGDLIAHTNLHATFQLHEQPNDQFKVTWKISVMRGRTPWRVGICCHGFCRGSVAYRRSPIRRRAGQAIALHAAAGAAGAFLLAPFEI
jgi:hypothetical protein